MWSTAWLGFSSIAFLPPRSFFFFQTVTFYIYWCLSCSFNCTMRHAVTTDGLLNQTASMYSIFIKQAFGISVFTFHIIVSHPLSCFHHSLLIYFAFRTGHAYHVLIGSSYHISWLSALLIALDGKQLFEVGSDRRSCTCGGLWVGWSKFPIVIHWPPCSYQSISSGSVGHFCSIRQSMLPGTCGHCRSLIVVLQWTLFRRRRGARNDW